MTRLEQAFTEDLQEKLARAEQECGVRQRRLAARVESVGGVACARELLGRRQISEGFAGLQQAGRLELSLEALVTAGKYGQLFTDEEVNCCFAALCDAGFYVWNHTP